MMFFGRKKEEVKKELNDIQKIKESVSSSAAPSTAETPHVSENHENAEAQRAPETDWMKEFEGSEKIPATDIGDVPENPKEWATQQIKLPPIPLPETHSMQPLQGPIPRVQMLQTPNVNLPPVHDAVHNFSKKQSEALVRRDSKAVESIPESAPLFIKLDRYKNILSTMADLRDTVSKVRNAFGMFGEMERIKAENLRVIEAVMQKVESRIVDLDNEFMKPVQNLNLRGGGRPAEEDWQPEQSQQPADDNLHKMIQDLHGQIGKLKSELDQMGVEEKKIIEEFD